LSAGLPHVPRARISDINRWRWFSVGSGGGWKLAKRTYSGRNMGTGIAVGGGTLALGAWSPVADLAVMSVAILLALTVVVVVLTAARSHDKRRQRNSAAVLDSLLRLICGNHSD
jgi:hypothetical protein